MNLAESIVLVYDPVKTAQGMLSFRAFRVTQKYLDLVKDCCETGVIHPGLLKSEQIILIRNPVKAYSD